MTHHLKPEHVPAHLRGAYTGRQFEAEVTGSVTIPRDAGLWSGGSRDTYRVVRLADGHELAGAELDSLAPWARERGADRVVALIPGIAVVRHTMFCGKDHGLTFYVHPGDVAVLIPAPSIILDQAARDVLKAVASYKSSYGGRDRRQMWNADHVRQYSPQDWEAVKARLIAMKLLNRAGAITVDGRNALGE